MNPSPFLALFRPNVAENHLAAARQRVARAQRVLLLTHVNPDGDAIGSLLGLGLALRAAGKQVTFACSDVAPDNFRFLQGFAEISQEPRGEYDLIVALDAADLGRLGKLGKQLPRLPDVMFDHHATNPSFATINLLDVQAASTAELITELLEPLGLPLTRVAAEALLVGVITDTMGFRTSSTTAKTLALVQVLMQAGASLPELYDLAFFKRSYYTVRLWGQGLSRIKLEERLVWTSLTLADKAAAQYPGSGDGDLINILSAVREAEVAVIFTERPENKVKVSWRAVPGVDVAKLAALFGGGGHVAAAGAEVTGTLAEVETAVLAATRAVLKNDRNKNGAKRP